MTVARLIGILRRFDPDDLVLVNGYEYGLCEVKRADIRSIRFNKNVHTRVIAGPHEEDKEGVFFGALIGRS